MKPSCYLELYEWLQSYEKWCLDSNHEVYKPPQWNTTWNIEETEGTVRVTIQSGKRKGNKHAVIYESLLYYIPSNFPPISCIQLTILTHCVDRDSSKHKISILRPVM